MSDQEAQHPAHHPRFPYRLALRVWKQRREEVSLEDFANIIDDLKCQLQLLNENMERWFRVMDPTDATKEDEGPF